MALSQPQRNRGRGAAVFVHAVFLRFFVLDHAVRWLAPLARLVSNLSTANPPHALGRQGERIAAEYLRQLGLRVIARGYRTPVGELDLICRDGPTLVFVEVKTRSDRIFADPQDSVTAAKMKKLGRAAAWYVHRKRCQDAPLRFDVLTVTYQDGSSNPPEIVHFPAAFTPIA